MTGFGYDGLHEMWEGYRDGLSALALLVEAPDVHYMGPDGLRVVWLESAAARIPQDTPCSESPTAAYPWTPSPGRSRGQASRERPTPARWVWGETGNFFLDDSYEDGNYDGFADPWEDELIEQGTQEWRKASALMDSVGRLADWLEGDLPGRFAEMLDFVLGRLPDQEQEENR